MTAAKQGPIPAPTRSPPLFTHLVALCSDTSVTAFFAETMMVDYLPEVLATSNLFSMGGMSEEALKRVRPLPLLLLLLLIAKAFPTRHHLLILASSTFQPDANIRGSFLCAGVQGREGPPGGDPVG